MSINKQDSRNIEDDSLDQKKSKYFNSIYYLNFTKVYEIAMMINNVILTKIEKGSTKSFEDTIGFTSSVSAQGTKKFLDGIKASISVDAKETSFSSSRIIETLDVKTTKSILLRRVIDQCSLVSAFDKCSEGDLVKVDRVKLELLDEESLRQFLILRRDALKGFRVEGMELNNLIGSILQDYAYLLKEIGMRQNQSKESTSKIIKSATSPAIASKRLGSKDDEYHFLDTLAIIQNVAFKLEESTVQKLHWWNRLGIWLSKLGRR